MKINITKRSRRLETISKGDLLLFPDRGETVREVDIKSCSLYTRRLSKNTDNDSIVSPKDFPLIEESIAYHTEKITPASKGWRYDWNWTKRRSA